MDARETLNRLGLDAKKSLGQNFMVEEPSLRRLTEIAGLDGTDCVLEIGAGLGALTEHLARTARRVLALEIDRRYIAHLQETFADRPQVEVVEADVLTADIEALLGEDAADYVAIGNLPYYITTAIMRRLLEDDPVPRRMVMTMQLEVAERITATPDDMSLLAVSVQVYGTPSVEARLKPGNFYPRPNVDSAIVLVVPFDQPLIGAEERTAFFRMVKAGFSQPRKQVKNGLSAGLHLDKGQVTAWLESAGIDPRRRAETLTVEEWITLSRAMPG